jgi:hypothetical protein
METLDGLVTIRAFNWSRSSINHNFEIVDRSQKPNYLMWAIKRWLALVLDLVITGIAVLMSACETALHRDLLVFRLRRSSRLRLTSSC